MKVVYMGTPDFSVGALRALAENGYEVCGVVTQPDKPKGRGKTLCPTPVKEEALRQGLSVFQPEKVRSEEFFQVLKELSPDLIVVAAFGQIIPRKILELPPYGCINIHASLLPKYRGSAPIQRAVIDGETESGVTIMKMDQGLDTGDMIAKVTVPLAEDETSGSLFEKLSEAGAKLLIETIPSIADGTAVYEKQPEESPTPYAAMITKKMGLMDFTKEAAELERLVRGMDPWPGAYTFLHGKTLKVGKSRVVAQAELGRKQHGEPGEVVKTGREGIYVSCGKDLLLLTRVQLEGKKMMEADAFLRGYELLPGTRFSMTKE